MRAHTHTHTGRVGFFSPNKHTHAFRICVSASARLHVSTCLHSTPVWLGFSAYVYVWMWSHAKGGGGLIDVDAVQTSLFKADVVKVAS